MSFFTASLIFQLVVTRLKNEYDLNFDTWFVDQFLKGEML